MNLGTLDLSTLPPTLAWCVVVVILICKVLPTVITFEGTRKISLSDSGTTTTTPGPTATPTLPKA